VNLPEYSLESKRAVVIGGGRGIGRGIARVLAEAGADVAVAALTLPSAQNAAADIEGLGRKSLALAVDATSEEEMDVLAQRVTGEFGPVQVVVNCVGESFRGPLVPLPGQPGKAMTPVQWRSYLDLNLNTIYHGCRVFGPHLLEQRAGSVINVSSFAAVLSRAGYTGYAAAKGAIISFTECLAMEWGPYGVRVNALSPGIFPDPDQVSPQEMAAYQERRAPSIPLQRLGTLREAGLLALFLASDAAAYVTGGNFCIDGGMTAG
jgi:NAD(P)-dependent dehydrogenase (short-subunit alcohol dehydrogenase family)